MEVLNLNYTKVMLQFYLDRVKAKRILLIKCLLRKIKVLRSQKLRDLYWVRQESLGPKDNLKYKKLL